MRVVLDESVPRQLRRDLEGFDIKTVKDMGWTGIKNGALLAIASNEFDAVFTVDRGMEQAHKRLDVRVGLVILAANTTDPVKLHPLMPRVRAALPVIQPGKIVRVDA